MRVAYLIVAHRNPAQVLRLTRHLTAQGDECFIHVDRKTDWTPFRVAFRHNPQVHLIAERHAVWWGGWSLVQAISALMRAALTQGGFDRLGLISETCYPCRPVAELKEHLSQNTEFLGIRRIAKTEKFWARYHQYRPMDNNALNPRGGLPPEVHKALRLYLDKFFQDIGCQPPEIDYPLFFGSTWWFLSTAAASHVIQTLDNEAHWRQRYAYVHAADEVVIPTIVGNSAFASRCGRGLHYIDWSIRPGPKTLELNDLDKVRASGRFFMRKCVAGTSTSLMDQIDTLL